MSSSETCVVHRVGAYPMVDAAVSAAGAGLEKAKATGYGVGAAAVWAEWLGGKGLGLGQRVVDTRPGQSLSKALAAKLPALEATLPAITMTGDQLKTNYYQGSKVAALVNTAGGWAALGKKTALAIGDNGVGKTSEALHSSIDLLNALLDRTEHFVDAKLGPSSTTGAGDEHGYAKGASASLSGRLATIMAKTSAGLRDRLPELRMPSVPEMPKMPELGKAAASASASVKELGGTMKTAATSVGARIRVAPESAAVGLVKLLLSLSSTLSTKALLVCPRPLYTPNRRVASYLEGLEKDVAESEGLGQVGGKLWTEVKAGREVLESSVVAALDAVSDAPPLSWISPASSLQTGTSGPKAEAAVKAGAQAEDGTPQKAAKDDDDGSEASSPASTNPTDVSSHHYSPNSTFSP